MTVRDIYEIIDKLAPFDSACEWDNCGLICGDMEEEVTGIYLTLDADLYALEKAKEKGANLVISHHPLIFDALRKVTSDNNIYHYIRKGVSVISAHTCLDAAKGGINDCLAQIAGLEDIKEMITDNIPLGRMGSVNISDSEAFVKSLCQRLDTGAQYVINGKIRNVAVVSGSGGGCMDDAIKSGCDTLITGEAKHDHFVKANDIGFNLIALGHFETENIILQPLYEKLRGICPVFISDRKYNFRRM